MWTWNWQCSIFKYIFMIPTLILPFTVLTWSIHQEGLMQQEKHFNHSIDFANNSRLFHLVKFIDPSYLQYEDLIPLREYLIPSHLIYWSFTAPIYLSFIWYGISNILNRYYFSLLILRCSLGSSNLLFVSILTW